MVITSNCFTTYMVILGHANRYPFYKYVLIAQNVDKVQHTYSFYLILVVLSFVTISFQVEKKNSKHIGNR